MSINDSDKPKLRFSEHPRILSVNEEEEKQVFDTMQSSRISSDESSIFNLTINSFGSDKLSEENLRNKLQDKKKKFLT